MKKCARILAWSSIGIVAALVVAYFRPEERLERSLATALTRDVREIERWAAGPPAGYRAPRVGSEAIPVLLRWLEEGELRPPLLYRVLRRVPMPDGLWLETVRLLEMNSSEDRIEKVDPSLQACAFRGFQLLNSNAAPALPELARLAREAKLTISPASSAMICMGEVALPTALEFARGEEASDRALGAYMIGALAIDGEVCVPVLRSLLRDESEFVRREAMRALGEFARSEAEPEIVALLREEAIAFDAAYALHGCGTNAVRLYLECLSSTQRNTRLAGMAGLSFRETIAKMKDANVNRHVTYAGKRSLFNAITLTMAWRLYADPDQEELFHLVRSNFQATGEPAFGASSQIHLEKKRAESK